MNCAWCKNSQIIGVISKTPNKINPLGYMSTTISISVVASTCWNHQYFHCCIDNNLSVQWDHCVRFFCSNSIPALGIMTFCCTVAGSSSPTLSSHHRYPQAASINHNYHSLSLTITVHPNRCLWWFWSYKFWRIIFCIFDYLTWCLNWYKRYMTSIINFISHFSDFPTFLAAKLSLRPMLIWYLILQCD